MIGTPRKALAEAIATFLFVLAIIAAVNSGSPLTPLAIGFTLMVLVYSTGHISGAHLNPAVSLGVFLRGGLSVADFVSYLVAQFAGGALAALVALAVWPAGEKAMVIEVGPAFLVEALFTLILVWVVLNSATSKDTAGNSFYGLAIGATVFVGAATVGSISGGGFNPAVALGLSVSGHFAWSSLWLYIVAPAAGAIIAALLFRVLNADDARKIAADAE
ncbi:MULTISPECIES: MIP/aquaporin family protein [unclassified Microbacterium]|uniref:MIP/aquaporin family protein n=1 Tax=unclassified Microbacterium TaxID=2609290 RepID=UPI001656D649|nr:MULTISPECIES: aquaporin [unclassified Microbacterium]MCT1364044.1 aquaporin [Microbacterium sp. p3-SID131]MCT1375314.1 aquaporin [Microbacterium sp. p3-SID337]MDH5132573.1 aquaporin [Microbacterium sp. RD10]MDH5136321.1 aquaporin [Microbacterium sp. RD11]MDH5143737.1 aquaporin [Microbacterium sp. RD12]